MAPFIPWWGVRTRKLKRLHILIGVTSLSRSIVCTYNFSHTLNKFIVLLSESQHAYSNGVCWYVHSWSHYIWGNKLICHTGSLPRPVCKSSPNLLTYKVHRPNNLDRPPTGICRLRCRQNLPRWTCESPRQVRWGQYQAHGSNMPGIGNWWRAES